MFWGEQKEPVYQFDMLPLKDQKNPGFINIQQYYLEDYLIDALEALDNVEIRWGHTLSDIDVKEDSAALSVTTRDGDYTIEADYVLACDGANSTILNTMGLDYDGRIFEDNFWSFLKEMILALPIMLLYAINEQLFIECKLYFLLS